MTSLILGGSREKNPNKDLEKTVFQLLNLSQSVFVLENPTHFRAIIKATIFSSFYVKDIFQAVISIKRFSK